MKFHLINVMWVSSHMFCACTLLFVHLFWGVLVSHRVRKLPVYESMIFSAKLFVLIDFWIRLLGKLLHFVCLENVNGTNQGLSYNVTTMSTTYMNEA